MYKFDPGGTPLSETLRALALSQIDEILGGVNDPQVSREDAVHEGRRRCKKLRGLLRLVRPAFADFGKENAALRDAAALLAHLRDADVLKHTINELSEHAGAGANRLRAIAGRIAEIGDDGPHDRLVQFRTAIEEIRGRAERWTLASEQPSKLMEGLRATYRKGRRLMRKAERTRLATQLHEWRKATKNHGFHIDLLKRVAPDLLEDDLKTVERLATCLGLHHDLAVLNEAIASAPHRFGDAADVSALRDAILCRIPEIEREAFDLGREIFAERSKAVAKRFRAYWQAAA